MPHHINQSSASILNLDVICCQISCASSNLTFTSLGFRHSDQFMVRVFDYVYQNHHLQNAGPAPIAIVYITSLTTVFFVAVDLVSYNH